MTSVHEENSALYNEMIRQTEACELKIGSGSSKKMRLGISKPENTVGMKSTKARKCAEDMFSRQSCVIRFADGCEH